jgi:threonine/homoserine/homoserine lactone efflux protein
MCLPQQIFVALITKIIKPRLVLYWDFLLLGLVTVIVVWMCDILVLVDALMAVVKRLIEEHAKMTVVNATQVGEEQIVILWCVLTRVPIMANVYL